MKDFHDFQLPRMTDVPPIKVEIIAKRDKPGGLGEVGVPPVAPAVANAVFALTGRRIRALPLEDAGIYLRVNGTFPVGRTPTRAVAIPWRQTTRMEKP